MKILNWMQRKLHPATDYSRFSPKKAPTAFGEDTGELSAGASAAAAAAEAPDAEAPLLRHVLEGTILTIGTLGHPLLLPHFSEEEPGLESPQQDPPAPPKPASCPMARTLPQPENDLFMIKGAEHRIDAEEKTMAEPLLKGDRERKERTTLAELFAADPAAPAKSASSLISTPFASALKITGADSEKKKGKNKKKEGEEANSPRRPAAAERLHRMITRMVKKKIHPEAAAAPGKKAGGAAFAIAADALLLGVLGGLGGPDGGGGSVQ